MKLFTDFSVRYEILTTIQGVQDLKHFLNFNPPRYPELYMTISHIPNINIYRIVAGIRGARGRRGIYKEFDSIVICSAGTLMTI